MLSHKHVKINSGFLFAKQHPRNHTQLRKLLWRIQNSWIVQVLTVEVLSTWDSFARNNYLLDIISPTSFPTFFKRMFFRIYIKFSGYNSYIRPSPIIKIKSTTFNNNRAILVYDTFGNGGAIAMFNQPFGTYDDVFHPISVEITNGQVKKSESHDHCCEH